MNDTPSAPDKLLITVHDAARMISTSERTLWSLTSPRGALPCVRIGRAVRYDPRDLAEWIASSREGGRR